jgi:hypothetical protein
MAITHVLQFRTGVGTLPEREFSNLTTMNMPLNAFSTGEPWSFDTEPSDASLEMPIVAFSTGEPWSFDTEPSDASLEMPIVAFGS